MTLSLKRLENPINRTERQGINENWTKIEYNFNNVVEKIGSEAFDEVIKEARLIWKEPVNTFADLTTTYPNAEEGWAAWAREVVGGVAKAYRYNGTNWVLHQEFTGDAIVEVDNRLSERIAQISYDLTILPTSDAVDASPALQSLINQARANSVKKIVIPKRTYRLNTLLTIDFDDLEIDFSGSTILNYAKANANIWGEVGMINFRGSFVDSDVDVISYIRSLYGSNHTPPTDAPVLLTYESTENYGRYEVKNYGRITTSNNDYFDVGDEVLLMGWTRPEGAPYVANKFEPELRVVAKVVGKDASYLYVDYYSPFTYPPFVNNALFKSRAIKVETIKDVTIKNVKIIEMNKVAVINEPTPTEKRESMAAIVPILVDGFNLENVWVQDTLWSAVFPWCSRNLDYKNLHSETPRAWGGGQGYTIQHISCREIQADVVTGNGVRHVIDFSANSNTATVTNSHGVDVKDTSFLLHGMCEHDVHFERCKGLFGFASGLAGFPNIAANVTYTDCDIYFITTLDNSKWVNNVALERCTVKTEGLPHYLNMIFRDCTIECIVNNVQAVVNKRGIDLRSSLLFDNCKFNIRSDSSSLAFIYIVNYDDVEFINTRVDFLKGSTPRPITFEFIGVENLEIVRTQLENILMRYRNTRTSKARILLNGNEFNANINSIPYLLKIFTLTNCNLTIEYCSNHVKNSATSFTYTILDENSVDTSFTNSTIISNLHDNIFDGGTAAPIHYLYTPSDGKTVAVDHSNIIRNKSISALFNPDKNTFI